MKVAVTTLVFCVAALLALGMVMLYSSSLSLTRPGPHLLFMQLSWCGLGLVLCVTAASLDYRLLKKFAWPIFGLAIILLVLVLLPLPHGVTRKINGARRWFSLGGASFQPSEVAKLALLVMLAWYGERCQRQMHTWSRGILAPGILVGTVLVLIFIEPDRGSTILLAAVSATVLLIAGVRWRYFVPPLLMGLMALAISIAFDPMRKKRIFSWLYMEEHKSGVGYQAYQSMLALGSGGWTGLGLGNGRAKHGFVPEHQTDFIFSVIGEELGLIATLLVVAAFVVIVLCGVFISFNARDTFGFLLGTGVTFLIGLQAFINIGVVTSALPNKGLPLPFISYGGSNLMSMLISIGILLSIARQSRARELPALGDAELSDDLPAAQPT